MEVIAETLETVLSSYGGERPLPDSVRSALPEKNGIILLMLLEANQAGQRVLMPRGLWNLVPARRHTCERLLLHGTKDKGVKG